MISNFRTLGVFAFVGLAAAAFSQGCGGGLNVPGVPLPGGKCPDLNNVEALADFDWAANFQGIDAKLAADLKAGVPAAVDIGQLAGGIDADLKTGCGGLAKDLGGGGDFKTGEEACKAAAKVVGEFKAKLGAKATVGLDVEPPRCGAAIDVYASCSGKCDANVKPGEAKVTCEEGKLQGECSGQCEGHCEASGGMKCEAQCSGKCDAQIKGKCSGTCDGKCEGQQGKTSCGGTCEGKCDADMQGECKGECKGNCEVKGKAECKGTCTGKCSVEMKAPKCTGEAKPPQMSAECKARCDAHANAKLECTPAHVVLRIMGHADAKLEAQFRGAIEKNFPIIAKVAFGMVEKAPKVAGNVETVVKSVQGSVQAASNAVANDAAKAPTLASLTACVTPPFKGALDAVGGITGSVQASVSVKTSIEAKGSASASTK